jgi:AraC family transcriptional activator of pobA
MKSSDKIKTYDTSSFREKYMKSDKALDKMLKQDFGKFFIVKVEDMIRLIKLPVPPTKSIAHTCIYITDGEAVMSVGNVTYTVKKNDFLFVPAGSVYSFKNHDVNKGYLVHFHNNLLIGKLNKSEALKKFEFMQVWGNPYIKLGKEASLFILNICQRLYLEYQKNGIQSIDIIHPYLIALLAELNSMYKPVSNSKQLSAVSITNKFKELVFANIKTMHLVSDYASELNISPNHLNKSVKAITGKSPTKWIDEAIVLEAKVLLFQTNLSIYEIATEVGHFDQSYFSRLFKKYEGVTPLEFRNRIEKS